MRWNEIRHRLPPPRTDSISPLNRFRLSPFAWREQSASSEAKFADSIPSRADRIPSPKNSKLEYNVSHRRLRGTGTNPRAAERPVARVSPPAIRVNRPSRIRGWGHPRYNERLPHMLRGAFSPTLNQGGNCGQYGSSE